MKKARFLVAMLLPVLAGVLMTTQDALAACKSEKVKLSVNEYGLWLKPDGGAKCLPVADPAAVSVSFPIELKTPGSYALRDGQVHVRQALAKEIDGAAIDCSDNLEFEETEYTNTGEDDIIVTVVGTDSAFGEYICYEIVVDDIGMLDPRAEVDDQFTLRGDLAVELADLIGAFELLIESGLGDPLTGVSLGDFIEANYGMTEEEARRLIGESQE